MKKKMGIGGLALGFIGVVAGGALYAKEGSTPWLLLLAGGAIALFLGLYFCTLKENKQEPSAPAAHYRKKRTYITRAEWEFLQLLRSVLGSDYEVCVQAPLVSVLEKESSGYRGELFRVVDYLIVDPVSYAPLLFIELNDASHSRPDRIARDEKVFSLCSAADMPIVAFTTAQSHDAAFVRKTLLKMLK